MSYYRLYFRDREGHFSGCRQFQAPSDAQAIGRADRMARGFNRELWWESRLLRQWGDGTGHRHFERRPFELDAFPEGMRVRSGSEDSGSPSVSGGPMLT